MSSTSSENSSGCVVIMGVAGCGKSSLGLACAQALGLPLIEGDDFHTTSNRIKMQSGVPLTDEDRAVWLDMLAGQLFLHAKTGAVLTCSALRQRYRDRLREVIPDLRFVFLSLTPEQARVRVAARPAHLFPVSLVDSQFKALEDPSAEPGVLRLDATSPLDELTAAATRWLQGQARREEVRS